MPKKRAIQIYPPDPRLSPLDKHLIVFLADILVEDISSNSNNNRDVGSVPLSDHQAERLLLLLAELLANKKFLTSLSYVDIVTSGERPNRNSVRDMQKLQASKGKPVLFAEAKHNDFKARLGVAHKRTDTEPTPMTFEHYLRMERRLVEQLKIDPRVVDLIMLAASKHERTLREILRATNSLKPEGNRSRRVTSQVKMFYESLSKRFELDFDLTVGRDQLVGLITVVSNATVIFTSRDWDVAGTMSAICGGLGLAIPSRRN